MRRQIWVHNGRKRTTIVVNSRLRVNMNWQYKDGMPAYIWTCAVAVLMLVTWGVSANQSTSGMRVTVAETALKQINTAELAEIRRDLQGKRFPDASGGGKVEWKLSNIRVTDVGTLVSTLNIRPTNQVTWSGRLSSLGVKASWRVKAKIDVLWGASITVSDSGDVSVSVSNTAVSITLGIAEQSGGLRVTLSACTANVGDVSLNIKGNLPSWIYDFVERPFEDALEGEMEIGICDALKKALMELSEDMSTLDTTYDIKVLDVPMVFDNSFTAISTTDNQITTLHKAAIVWRGQRFETNTDVSLPALSQRHIAFDLREDVLNNLLEAFVRSGQLNGGLTYQEIEAQDMHQFGLTCRDPAPCVGKILQESAVLYPDRVVALNWTITNSSLSIEAGSMSGKLVGRTDFFAASASDQVFLFSAKIDLSVFFQARFSGGDLTAKATGLGGSITVDRSDIGKVFHPDVLAFTQDILLVALKSDIEKMLNEYNTSFPIKLPKGVSFKTSNVVFYKEVIRVEADVCYKTPACVSSGTDAAWVGSSEKGRIRLYDVVPTTTSTTTTTTTTQPPMVTLNGVTSNGQKKLNAGKTSGQVMIQAPFFMFTLAFLHKMFLIC